MRSVAWTDTKKAMEWNMEFERCYMGFTGKERTNGTELVLDRDVTTQSSRALTGAESLCMGGAEGDVMEWETRSHQKYPPCSSDMSFAPSRHGKAELENGVERGGRKKSLQSFRWWKSRIESTWPELN